jgi:hypothetical protein
MTSTITRNTIDWRGILIQVTFTEYRDIDHLEILTLEPEGGAIPITETGYKSHFLPCGIVQNHGGPLDYVMEWLEAAATERSWIDANETAKQLCLF